MPRKRTKKECCNIEITKDTKVKLDALRKDSSYDETILDLYGRSIRIEHGLIGINGGFYDPLIFVPEGVGEDELVEVVLNIDPILKTKVDAVVEDAGFKNWEEWLNRQTAGVLSSTENATIINATTVLGLIPMWSLNFSDNLPILKERVKDITGLCNEFVGKRVIVVGAGPSIYRRNHLDILKASV